MQYIAPLPSIPCPEIPPFGTVLWSSGGKAYLYTLDDRPLLLGLTDGSAFWNVREVLKDAHDFQWR